LKAAGTQSLNVFKHLISIFISGKKDGEPMDFWIPGEAHCQSCFQTSNFYFLFPEMPRNMLKTKITNTFTVASGVHVQVEVSIKVLHLRLHGMQICLMKVFVPANSFQHPAGNSCAWWR
jgi:hypothetical protein